MPQHEAIVRTQLGTENKRNQFTNHKRGTGARKLSTLALLHSIPSVAIGCLLCCCDCLVCTHSQIVEVHTRHSSAQRVGGALTGSVRCTAFRSMHPATVAVPRCFRRCAPNCVHMCMCARALT